MGLWIAFTARKEVGFERRRRKSVRPSQALKSSPDSQLLVWPPVSHGGFPSMTPPKSDRLLTRGTSARSSVCDIYKPPSPRPLVRAHTGPSSAMPLGLVRHRESFQNPPVKLRLAARGCGGAGARTPGLALGSQGALGVAGRSAPRPERAPAPQEQCGVSVSPAGFSPLRWSGK